MADQFNPQANLPNSQDFLGYSKGVRDNSLGEFTSGLAGTLDSGLKAIDRGVAEMANNEVDKVVNDTDASLLGIKNQGPAVDPLKAEIKQQVGNLADKKLAMDNGTIDPQHYYATIQAKVKDIRTRYSGYNPQIDEELSRIGIDPNWQRKQIIAEGEKAANAKANAAQEAIKDARRFKEKALTDPNLLLPKGLRDEMTNDPNFELHPDKMKALRGAYANSNALTSDWMAEKAQAELAVSKGKAQSVALGETYGNGLNLILHKAAVNSGAQELVTNLAKKAQDEFNATGAVSATTDNDLRMAYGKFRSDMNTARLGLKGQYADSASLFPEEMKKQDDNFDLTLEQMGQAITNKDYGALLYNVNGIAAYSNASKAKLLSSPPAAAIASIKETGGDAAVAAYSATNSNLFDPYTKYINGINAEEMLSGKVKSLNDSMNNLRNNNINDPAAYRANFDQHINMLLDPEVKDKGKMNLAKGLFGPDNQSFWDNLDNNSKLTDADRRAYARRLASPEMAKEIDRLSAIDPRLKEQYLSYTHFMFQKMNKDTATNVNNVIKNADDMTVTYNPVTNHLDVVPVAPKNQSTFARVVSGGTSLLRGNSAKNAVDNFNTGVDIMTPIWKSYGIDPKEASQGMVTNLGIELNAPKVDNPLNDYAPPATGFSGPRGAPTTKESMGSGGLDVNKRPDAINPRGAPTAGQPNVQDSLLRNLRFQVPSNLGGPQEPAGAGLTGMGEAGRSVPQYASAAFAQALAAHSPEALDARAGILKEVDQLHKMQDSTDDPAKKAMLQKEIDSQMEAYRTMRQGPIPQEPQASFQPRGNPAPGTPTDAQAATGKSVVDAVTGIPSLVDAIQSGKPKDLAMAMATIIPFPVGKATLGIKKLSDILKPEILSKLPVEKISSMMDDLEAAMARITSSDKLKEVSTIHNALDKELEKRGLDTYGNPMKGMTDAELEASVKALEDKFGKKNSDSFTRTVMKPNGKTTTTEGLTAAELAAARSKPNLTVIQGGAEKTGVSNASLRLADEPLPKDLGASATKYAADDAAPKGYKKPQLRIPEGPPAGKEFPGQNRFSEQQLVEIRYNQKLYDITQRIQRTGSATDREALLQEKRAILNARKEWRNNQ